MFKFSNLPLPCLPDPSYPQVADGHYICLYISNFKLFLLFINHDNDIAYLKTCEISYQKMFVMLLVQYAPSAPVI